MRKSYVYEITIGPNKQIGSTFNLEKRMYRHLYYLKNNIHWNSHMQNSYNKYQSFSYIILFEYDDRTEAYKKEQELLDKYFGKDGYLMKNPKAVGGCVSGEANALYGKKQSQELIDKRANALRGNKCSEETKQKISKSKKGKYCGENHPMFGKKHNEESKLKMSFSQKNKEAPSEETRKKLSKANKGEKNYFYGKKFIKEQNHFYGKTHTEETKKKISLANSFVKEKIKCPDCERFFDPGNYKKHTEVKCEITLSIINKIIDLYKSGRSKRSISIEYNIGIKLITNIIKESCIK